MATTLKTRPLTAKQVDAVIERAFNRHSSGVQIPILKIRDIYTAGRTAYKDTGDAVLIEPAVIAALQPYRVL